MIEPGSILWLAVKREGLDIGVRGVFATHLYFKHLAVRQLYGRMLKQG